MSDYASLLDDVKTQIDSARPRAAVSLNAATLKLYWRIGRLIVERQERDGWGDAVIERLARDLRKTFPKARGISARNLLNRRSLFRAYRNDANSADAFAAFLAAELRKGDRP